MGSPVYKFDMHANCDRSRQLSKVLRSPHWVWCWIPSRLVVFESRPDNNWTSLPTRHMDSPFYGLSNGTPSQRGVIPLDTRIRHDIPEGIITQNNGPQTAQAHGCQANRDHHSHTLYHDCTPSRTMAMTLITSPLKHCIFDYTPSYCLEVLWWYSPIPPSLI